MKQILLLLYLTSSTLWAQKNIYESARFDELTKNHKVLAILPFTTQLDLKEDFSKKSLLEHEEKEGYAVQKALESYFSKGKKRKRFSVDFQNINTTNNILREQKITYGNFDVYTIKELANILGVDGVISGNLTMNLLLSEGISTELSFMDYVLGVTDFGRIGIKVSDGKTGKLLWKYEKTINKKTGKDTDDLIDGMMKKATRKFPYDKERINNRNRN